MAAATRLLPPQLVADITATLARLRIARTVDPNHQVLRLHNGCDICTSERRLDWLLSQIPTAQQPQGTAS